MQITEITSAEHIREFHRLPFTIYKNDPFWIPHPIQDVEAVFDPGKNIFFTHGAAARWILTGSNGQTIGRVAAFINNKLAHSFKQPTGGMGFFECINDPKAAFILFDKCRDWLQEQGMEAMDGPVNFGEKDKYWGVIVENFECRPYYGQNYNPPYYVDFFENYGFKVYYYQLIFHRKVEDPCQEKYLKRAKRIAENPKYSVRSIVKSRLGKFAEDFRTVYNRAWVTHDNFKPMEKEQAMSLMNKLKPVLDEDLAWFVYYEDKPVAFYISLPEINQLIAKAIGSNGNFNWWGKLKFLYYKWQGVCKTCFGIAFGIDPDHQGKGIEGAIFNALGERIQPTMKYSDIIITWIGDFNPLMIHILEALGTKEIRRMATYRKLFDENAEFERSPVILPVRRKTVPGKEKVLQLMV